jgi:hypothetical protein
MLEATALNGAIIYCFTSITKNKFVTSFICVRKCSVCMCVLQVLTTMFCCNRSPANFRPNAQLRSFVVCNLHFIIVLQTSSPKLRSCMLIQNMAINTVGDQFWDLEGAVNNNVSPSSSSRQSSI